MHPQRRTAARVARPSRTSTPKSAGAAAHLVEPRADGAWRFVRSAGSPAAPALMAGALRYANAPLELDRYRCRYVSVDPLFGGEAWTDEALAFSDDLEGGDPLRALSVTCPGTRWGFAEGAANVSVFDGDLILEYVGPANSSAPLVVLRSRWSGLGVRVMDAWGGDALEVNGAGFDQEPNRTNYTCVYSSVTGGSTVVSGSQVVAPDVLHCLSPVWEGPADTVGVAILRGDNSTVEFWPAGPAPLLELSEGWAAPQPSRAPTFGGSVITVLGFRHGR